MKRRLFALVLAAVMLCGAFSTRAYAKNNKELEENMKEVVATVKEKLGLGKDLTDFSYYVSTDEEGRVYSFSWTDTKNDRSIAVDCDDKGRIRYFYTFTGHDSVKPEYLKSELESVARGYIEQIAPELKDHIELASVDTSTWNNTYCYRYDRCENGIKVRGNDIRVSVGYTDKVLYSYDCNWVYNVKVPSAQGIMSLEDAKKKISNDLEMELSYHITYDENGELKAFLAYEPVRDYIAVDAKNGKIYTEINFWSDDEDYDEENDGIAQEAPKEAGVGGRDYSVLTDDEIEKIVGVNELLSKDEAVEKLRNNKYLYIDEEYTSIVGSLEKNGDSYVWMIMASDDRPVENYDEEDPDYDPEENYRGYFYARMDAKTGELLYYSSNVRDSYKEETKRKYNKKQCREIFESFANEENKDQFSQTKLTDSTPSIIDYIDEGIRRVYGYRYDYQRYHKGIRVGYDSISGEVDGVSGKVYQYETYFSDVKLPSPKNVIGAEKAREAYLSYDGFDLVYEVYTVTKKDKEKKIYVTTEKMRLAYATHISPDFVDANTGKQLDYSGKEYVKPVVDGEYTDIAGDKAEREIGILAELGVRFGGDKFEPSKVITRQEFYDLLKMTSYGGMKIYYEPTYGDEGKDKVEGGDKALTREHAALLLAKFLGYEKIAGFDIYKTGFGDNDKISVKYRGSVAIVTSLGYMEADGQGNFNPETEMTRSDAALLLIKLI